MASPFIQYFRAGGTVVDYRDRSPWAGADLVEKIKAMQESQILCAEAVPCHSVGRLDGLRLLPKPGPPLYSIIILIFSLSPPQT